MKGSRSIFSSRSQAPAWGRGRTRGNRASSPIRLRPGQAWLLHWIFAAICGFAAAAHGFDIQLRPNAELAANAPALAAFERAAAAWERVLADPIVIRIDAGIAPLDSGILGQADTTVLFGDNFAEFRDALVLDDAREGGSFVQALPAFSQLSAALPQGRTLFDSLGAAQANLKALGFTDLEAISGHEEDATITFNSNFAFDLDNRDGVESFQVDFETVALHEIGHALGFLSIVDTIDGTFVAEYPEVTLLTLDLFRFGRGASANPFTLEEFASFPRELRPGGPAHFDDLIFEVEFATGVNFGDGTQASHWKDDELGGGLLGMMDPTLNFGTSYGLSPEDLRAFDAIGYQIIPEPGYSLLPYLATFACWRRRTKTVVADDFLPTPANGIPVPSSYPFHSTNHDRRVAQHPQHIPPPTSGRRHILDSDSDPTR